MSMWSDEFKIGNTAIDNQHKQLFAAGSKILKNYWNKQDFDKEPLIDTINFLKDYAISHFNEEERLQIALKYKGYAEHKKQHEVLLKKVLAHEEALIETDFSPKEVDLFIATLITWLTYHVAIEDKKITKKSFLNVFR